MRELQRTATGMCPLGFLLASHRPDSCALAPSVLSAQQTADSYNSKLAITHAAAKMALMRLFNVSQLVRCAVLKTTLRLLLVLATYVV